VLAFTLDGFTAAETADALNITQQRVRDVMKKARATLRKQLSGPTAA
jgi:DNA-directed RNA polymerase specialized sigma24 family protein